MASRTPEFGKWEDEDVPYSQVFDKARKNRADRKANKDNPYDTALVKSPKHEASKQHLDGRSPKHQRQISREEVDLKRLTDSPLIPSGSPYHRHHHHRHGTTSSSEIPTTNRTAKQSVGSDRSFNHSPLHPQHYQSRATAVKGSAGVSSPVNYERKGSSEGNHSLAAPSTPGRSRLRQITRGNETSDQSAVPRFGDWDESDPTAAEGFTEVFEDVRKQRQNMASGRVPTTTTDQYSQSNRRQQPVKQNSKKCRCFPWGGM